MTTMTQVSTNSRTGEVSEEVVKGFIYIVTHKETGAKYVGKTLCKKVEHRWASHYWSVANGSQLYFHNALRKYGKEAFTWGSYEFVGTRLQLCDEEVRVISEFTAQNVPLYNLTTGGEGCRGMKHSPERNAKFSAKMKGRTKTLDHKRKISEALQGHPVSEESRAKMALAKLGRVSPKKGKPSGRKGIPWTQVQRESRKPHE